MLGTSINIIQALVVRCALALHTILTVWRVTENLHDQMYWLLCCLMVPFLVEGIYSIVRRQGKEYLWFSPCFFFYLCATLPPIWLLELDKSRQVRENENPNRTAPHHNYTETQLAATIPVDLNPNMWTIVIEEMLLYLLVIGRWILPRGEVTREQLSELMFAFIGIAADVMEFFSLFGEGHVRNDEVLGYLLLSIWSLSILQFTMAVTVTQQPKRAKKITTVRSRYDEPDEEEEPNKLSSELFAIFISMAMQDVPFLVLRLYTIINFNLITYSLIFFTSKNVLVISLLFYKVAVLLQGRYCPELESKEDNEDDEVIAGGFGEAGWKGDEKVGGKGDGGGRESGDGDDVSQESSPSKYALPYEYAGMTPELKKHSGDGNGKHNGELNHRKVSKPNGDTPSNKSGGDGRPNEMTFAPGEEKNKEKGSNHSSPGSPQSPINEFPANSSKSSSPGPKSAGDSTSGTPKSPDNPKSEGGNSPSPGESPELKSADDANEPVIISPIQQDAQPGDPDFKPYTSVVRLP